jgi:hypothetical protein
MMAFSRGWGKPFLSLIPTWSPRLRGVVIATGLLALAATPTGAFAVDQARSIDTDMPGLDYKHFDLPRASESLCQFECYSEQQCRAWVYVKPQVFGNTHAVCWLKAQVPVAHADTCCTSGLH